MADDSARRAQKQQCGVPNGSHVILDPDARYHVTATLIGRRRAEDTAIFILRGCASRA
jgi:hypothetical protein